MVDEESDLLICDMEFCIYYRGDGECVSPKEPNTYINEMGLCICARYRGKRLTGQNEVREVKL